MAKTIEIKIPVNRCDYGSMCSTHRQQYCRERSPNPIYICTLKKGHPGNHIACVPSSDRASDHNIISWNDLDIKEDKQKEQV